MPDHLPTLCCQSAQRLSRGRAHLHGSRVRQREGGTGNGGGVVLDHGEGDGGLVHTRKGLRLGDGALALLALVLATLKRRVLSNLPGKRFRSQLLLSQNARVADTLLTAARARKLAKMTTEKASGRGVSWPKTQKPQG
eukprot:354459-Prorocentrum_minimum.AAC.4